MTAKTFTSCCIFGSKGVGKSTLMGRFIYELGGFSERDLEKSRREAIEFHGVDDYTFAFFSDKRKIERISKQSIYNSTREFYTNKYHIALTDTPGDIKYKAQKIRGISVSDFGILVLSAAPNDNCKQTTFTNSNKMNHTIISYWTR
eukprot:322253_1